MKNSLWWTVKVGFVYFCYCFPITDVQFLVVLLLLGMPNRWLSAPVWRRSGTAVG